MDDNPYCSPETELVQVRSRISLVRQVIAGTLAAPAVLLGAFSFFLLLLVLDQSLPFSERLTIAWVTLGAMITSAGMFLCAWSCSSRRPRASAIGLVLTILGGVMLYFLF